MTGDLPEGATIPAEQIADAIVQAKDGMVPGTRTMILAPEDCSRLNALLGLEHSCRQAIDLLRAQGKHQIVQFVFAHLLVERTFDDLEGARLLLEHANRAHLRHLIFVDGAMPGMREPSWWYALRLRRYALLLQDADLLCLVTSQCRRAERDIWSAMPALIHTENGPEESREYIKSALALGVRPRLMFMSMLQDLYLQERGRDQAIRSLIQVSPPARKLFLRFRHRWTQMCIRTADPDQARDVEAKLECLDHLCKLSSIAPTAAISAP